MSKYKRRIYKIIQVDRDLDYIERNIDYTHKEIIEDLCEINLICDSGLYKRFSSVYVSGDGYKGSLPSYIVRRQNKENIATNSNGAESEDRFDTNEILKEAIMMYIGECYGFRNTRLDDVIANYSDYLDKLNVRKFVKMAFSDVVYVFPDYGENYDYNAEEIISFNEKFLDSGKLDETDKLINILKFKYMYSSNYHVIGGTRYYTNRGDWLINIIKTIPSKDMDNISQRMLCYKTLVYARKDILNTNTSTSTSTKYMDALKEMSDTLHSIPKDIFDLTDLFIKGYLFYDIDAYNEKKNAKKKRGSA